MYKKSIYLLLVLFVAIISTKVYATDWYLGIEGCSTKEMSELNKVAGNIKINYEHITDQWFTVNIYNVDSRVFIVDQRTEYYPDSNGRINILYDVYKYRGGENYTLNVKVKPNINCGYLDVGSKYLSLPIYNKYYDSIYCKGIEELSYCHKWISKEYSEEVIKNKTNEYRDNLNKEPDKEDIEDEKTNMYGEVIQFIASYYLYIFPPILSLSILGIIIIKIRENKKSLVK